MKTIIYVVLAVVVVFLAFAFYNVTFSIAYWTPENRALCLIVAGISAFLTFTYPGGYDK